MKITVKKKTESSASVAAQSAAAPVKGTASRKKKAVKTVKGALELKRLKVKRTGIIEAIRDKLVRQRHQLLSEAEAAMNTMPSNVTFPDLGDQASAEIDRNFTIRLREREQKLLKKIDGAIEKIETGGYGLCEICGEEIGIGRLHARPVTSMCIDCKTEQEEEEKLREGWK
jgi:DnaK suppressor protein